MFQTEYTGLLRFVFVLFSKETKNLFYLVNPV